MQRKLNQFDNTKATLHDVDFDFLYLISTEICCTNEYKN